MIRLTKSERSWVLYDWANSAYSITITTAIFPLFFGQIAREGGLADTTSTAVLGYGNSFYALIIAILAPILGTMADYKGMRKKFFTVFLVVGTLATAMMIFIQPGAWLTAIILYMLTALGFAGANIFYDSCLVDVTEPDRMDVVSTRGFGWGYIGSTFPFVASLVVIFLMAGGDMSVLNITGVRIAFIITALWWFGFSIPFLKNVKQRYGIEPSPRPIRDAFGRLYQTFKHIRSYKKIFLFLLAYFFYIDGVGTIIKMATDYGSKMGISSTILLLDLMALQIVAFPFALLYGVLAKKTSTRFMLFVGIGIYSIITILGTLLPFMGPDMLIPMFILISFLVATSQGGIQGLSRSYFGALIPPDQAGEFFGFFDIFGKFAAIMGPFIMGFATQATGSYSVGIGCIIILFALGAFFLVRCGKSET
ncbi:MULTISPECIES: MFS transporter [unclassified Oceanispirochaeta]|uniref:MFS transporter n=1 Tax=unclassified Oceanispirochaeta TaxID=2635722 RepID=UPI000E09B249|nr:MULTISPECIES: MFS transporter [unclassified Oceanispirochaeta]MBF9017401.1 MFS transporter [Oceanispirochaeta sp. M2]NPD73775.1 MFS transporter [Oceanispirochaeta sp. M1]RDG30526.1 MFS transporter [Oceanispirochaeta sp. M1]